MKLPDSAWQKREGLGRLLAALDADRGVTRYVGGCVRDTLLGIDVSDVDLATSLQPDEVVRRLEKAGIKAIPTGIAHGTVTAVSKGLPTEVTTLRRDVSTDGRRATIAYTNDWREDAARRDFTVNALTADPGTAEVFDYFGGMADLEEGRVRFIGDPLIRIAEDHLRILRFFRFQARFGRDEPDPDALAACAARANDLMALSRERIADELLKLLRLPDPVAVVRLMTDKGILKAVLPEIGTESVRSLATLIARENQSQTEHDPLRRLAALLPADAEIAASIAARLRLSNKAAKRLAAAAVPEPADADLYALAYHLGAESAVDRILLGRRDVAVLEQLRGWQRPRLLVGGGDLIAMGLEPGPVVAETLQAIERDWAQAGFAKDKGEQRRLARRHVDQALRERQ